MSKEKTCGRCEHFEPVLGGFCKHKVLLGETGETRDNTPACQDFKERK